MAYTNDELEKLSPEEKNRKRRDIQTQIVMLEADANKMIGEKTALDAEIRKIKMDVDRFQVTLSEKNERVERVSSEILRNEEEHKKMKKKLNLL